MIISATAEDPTTKLQDDASTTIGSVNGHTESKKKVAKVIIIGAGFAGLSTAYNLLKLMKQKKKQHQQQQDIDIEIEIIEARDRLGGRVHPYDLDGTIIDMGGQWVHEASINNPIRRLLEDDLHIPFHRIDDKLEALIKKKRHGRSFVFQADGEEINFKTFKKVSKFYNKALNNTYQANVDKNTSMKDLIRRAINQRKKTNVALSYSNNIENNNNNESNGTKSSENDNNREFQQIINHLISQTEMYEGGRLNEISVYLNEMYTNLGGQDEVPTSGGYNTIIQEIYKRIIMDDGQTTKIRYNSVVNTIQYDDNDDGGIEITLLDINNEEEQKVTVHGDYCVCTVPLGVLQHRSIEFIPQLSEDRWNAIDSIGMGLLDKIALKFDKRFWDIEYEYFTITDDDITKVKSFYDCTDDVGTPILLMFHAGDAARRVDCLSSDALNDDEAVNEALEALRRIFGNDVVPTPVASYVTRWNIDPYSYGSYSFAKIGCTESVYDEISKPINNKLFFAGEHTSKTMHACVHGAWATGEREASRILEQLTKQK